MSFTRTDAYYQAARAVEVITTELVKHRELQVTARRARAFDRRVAESELWGSYRRLLRQKIWDLLNTPLPMDHQHLDLQSAGDTLARLLADLQGRSDLALTREATEIGKIVARLSRDNSDPLGVGARNILATGSPECQVVVVRDQYYREPIEAHFHDAGCPVRAVVPAEVPDLDVAETMILVGQAKFYPDHILNAPRARKVYVLRYEWLSDITRVEPLLPSQQLRPPVRSSVTPTRIEADFLVPGTAGIDWSVLQSAHAADARSDTLGDHSSDVRPARLFLLAGGHGVYLEAEQGHPVLSIDPETGRGGGSVQRLETSRVEPGNIIVLRRGYGGGDFIEDVANRLLGQQAANLRAVQREWTEALRNKSIEHTTAGVERDLVRLGVRARNVHYWMSSHSIRTATLDDFRKLMEYVGLGERSDEIWEQMGVLVRAHRKAGQRTRRMLLRRVQEADPAEITRDGLMDFELGDEYAGVLTAFRVEARSPGTIEDIPASRLREPFIVERGHWLE